MHTILKDKDKGRLMTCPCRHRGDAEVQLQTIRNLALAGGRRMEVKLPRNQEHNMQPSLAQYSPIV